MQFLTETISCFNSKSVLNLRKQFYDKHDKIMIENYFLYMYINDEVKLLHVITDNSYKLSV